MLDKMDLRHNDRWALAAASSAADAVAKLLDLVREDVTPEELEKAEVLERLLDAAKLVIEIGDDYSDERGQVYAAIARYLEGWAG